MTSKMDPPEFGAGIVIEESLNGGDVTTKPEVKVECETDARTIKTGEDKRCKKKVSFDLIDARPTELPSSGCERDAREYNMNHKRRGAALILNHKDIPGLRQRSGTGKDCHDLAKTLASLQFDVRVHEDCTYQQIRSVLAKTASEDHTDADCLVVTVMSHGEPGYLHSRDHPYQVKELWGEFTGDKCPSLAGKPKLFFIQACRGDMVDPGVKLCDSTDAYNMSYSVPVQADILVAYSTVEGFYSWRNPLRGAWFIQALCEELKTNSSRYDLVSLLTFVARRVALDYQSCVPNDLTMDQMKQVPTITSTLTRLIYLNKQSLTSERPSP